MLEQVFQPTSASELITTPARAAVEVERIGPPGAAMRWWRANEEAIDVAAHDEAPVGVPHGNAVLFGRLPDGVDRKPWCVPALRWQWAKAGSSWTRIFTPSGRAAEQLAETAAMDWLLERPATARWVMLSTQHGLLLEDRAFSSEQWHWLALLSDYARGSDGWPRPALLGVLVSSLYQVLGDMWQWGSLHDLSYAVPNVGLVIDDETKLVPSPDNLPRYQQGAPLADLMNVAELTEAQRDAALAGKYSTGAYRSDYGQQRLTDVSHRTTARLLGWAMRAHWRESPLCASNHGAYLPCVFPNGHGATYTQSPWGWGAPLESASALSSIKLYGGGWGKPGVWAPETRGHIVKTGAIVTPGTVEYAAGMALLCGMRARSAIAASRQRFGVWLQCNEELSPWMLSEAGQSVMRLAWILTASGGTVFVSTDGDGSADYSRQFFDALDAAREEVLAKIGDSVCQVRLIGAAIVAGDAAEVLW